MFHGTCIGCGVETTYRIETRPRTWCSHACRHRHRYKTDADYRATKGVFAAKSQPPCRSCGVEIPLTPGRGRPRVVCVECAPTNYPTAPSVPCATCGVEVTDRTGGRRFCLPCARNAELERGRAKRSKTRSLTCACCGDAFTAKTNRQFCSPACRSLFKGPSSEIPWRQCPECQTWMSRPGGRKFCSKECSGRQRYYQPKPPVVVTRSCPICEGQFESSNPVQKYCSKRCARRTPALLAAKRRSKDVRRARQKQAPKVEAIYRTKVYARDGWICQLCMEPVDRDLKHPDPMSPSLDHILPLSLGGAHTMANVQLAHLACNVRKGAEPQGEQLRLAG